MFPTFDYEKKLWKRGFRVVVGADEVGRGAWAGPLVAGAVAFSGPVGSSSHPMSSPFGKLGTAGTRWDPRSRHPKNILINDSKKLKPRERERAAEWIKENCLSWGIGEAAVSIINRVGMARATKMAFRQAVSRLVNKSTNPDFLLIDAFYLPYTKGLQRKNQLAIVKGDELSFSIAAASIIAKVYRDGLMRKFSRAHKFYGWGRNKGYGTREHQEGIRKFGTTRLHRRRFVPDKLITNNQLANWLIVELDN